MVRPNCNVGTVVHRRERPLSLVFFITFKCTRQLHLSVCPPEGCTQICHSSPVTLLMSGSSLGHTATLGGGVSITLWVRQAQRVGQMGGQHVGECDKFCLSDTTPSQQHHTGSGRGLRSEMNTDWLCDLGQVTCLNLLTYLHQLNWQISKVFYCFKNLASGDPAGSLQHSHKAWRALYSFYCHLIIIKKIHTYFIYMKSITEHHGFIV